MAENYNSEIAGITAREHDDLFGVKKVGIFNTDGQALRREISKQVAKKITTVSNDTYVAIAPIGTLQSDAKWQVKKISVSGSDMVTTWADGDALFDNVATDLTSLTYL